MAEGAESIRWWHTAHVLAMLANVNRDAKKSRAFKAADFHPYERSRRRSGIPLTKANVHMLKALVKEKPGAHV